MGTDVETATAIQLLRQEQHFLMNILGAFTPEHGDFRPTEESMTVAQQIRHIAGTLTWFFDGGLDDTWDLDFEKHEVEIKKPATLEEALAELAATYDRCEARLAAISDEQIQSTMAPNPILGERKRFTVIRGTAEHTAHHRGSLAVYQRLLGIVPKMAYSP